MNPILEKYSYQVPSPEDIERKLAAAADSAPLFRNREILLRCFSLMDLTTLRSQDTVESVSTLIEKVTTLKTMYPDYPLPASVCVYPEFASVVASKRVSPELHVTTVAGCFPSSQSFIDVKALECRMAVLSGADEVDIVLALNSFMAGDYETAASEIRTMRAAVDQAASEQGRRVILKVILETGLLVSAENIATASFLAMEAGADFIKTSTGKVDVNATPSAALIMCGCIAVFYELTGKKVGFKAAGGISNADDALSYYCIGLGVLGESWMNRDLFRFGVSRLGNSLMSAIEGRTIAFF